MTAAAMRDDAPRQRGVGEAAQQENFRSKVATDPREVQGIAPRRNSDQRPPAWPAPKGADAADALATALQPWSTLRGEIPVDPTRRGRS